MEKKDLNIDNMRISGSKITMGIVMINVFTELFAFEMVVEAYGIKIPKKRYYITDTAGAC